MKRLLCFLAVILAPVAPARDLTLAELFRGDVVPLKLTLKDLDGSWRRFGVGGGEMEGAVGAAYAAMLGASVRPVYYSRGETVTVDGEPFWIAYRLRTPAVDVAGLIQRGMAGRQAPPAAEKPTPDSELALALLPVRQTGPLIEITPFDLEVELAGGDASPAAREDARDRAARASQLDGLREAAKAVLLYAQDGDKSLPPLQSAEVAAKALQPYAKDRAIFQNLTPNSALAGKKLAEVPNHGGTVLFYETKPGAGGRGVAFLDGRTERVSPARWEELRAAGKLP